MAREVELDEIVSEWRAVETIGSADVLLLQEFVHHNDNEKTLLHALGKHLGYHFAFAPTDRLTDGYTQGLAIFSRYPLSDVRIVRLKYFPLRFVARCRIALAATVHTDAGPVRVVNLHLDSRINTKDRIAQLQPVREDARSFAGPQIIGGDFNTNPMFWIRTMWPLPFLQRQSKAVQTELAADGFHTPLVSEPATIRVWGIPLFKLDWLFVKGLEPISAGVSKIRFSDHEGVWVQVKLPGRSGDSRASH